MRKTAKSSLSLTIANKSDIAASGAVSSLSPTTQLCRNVFRTKGIHDCAKSETTTTGKELVMEWIIAVIIAAAFAWAFTYSPTRRR
jgi:hypothetical protein